MANLPASIEVVFFPTEKHIQQIEAWLHDEEKKTNEGFYCNWNLIFEYYQKNKMLVIAEDDNAIGFVTYRTRPDNTSVIQHAEIKPTHRNKGYGKILISQLCEYLRSINVYVIELVCNPKSSEKKWLKMGFNDFPEPYSYYNFSIDGNRPLYKIIVDSLSNDTDIKSENTIELWNCERDPDDNVLPPVKIWNLEFIKGTKKLIKPIVYPYNYDWTLRCTLNGDVIFDDRARSFDKINCYYAFMIIESLE